MWDVELERVRDWLKALSDDDYCQVMAALELLPSRPAAPRSSQMAADPWSAELGLTREVGHVREGNFEE